MFCGRCELCDDRGAGWESDACDAGSLVCCHERRGREMLGLQWIWPGDGPCCFVFTFRFERLLVLGECFLIADDGVFLCSSEITQQHPENPETPLPFLLSD